MQEPAHRVFCLITFGLFALPSCQSPRSEIQSIFTGNPGPGIAANAQQNRKLIQAKAALIRYLGTGGVAIQWRGSTILMAPFFSNPGMGKVCLHQGLGCLFLDSLFPFTSDKKHVRAHLRNIPELNRTEAILVGHAHYDHLMDIPETAAFIREKTGSYPVIYGSETTMRLLDRIGNAKYLKSIKNGTDTNQWIYLKGGKFRIMALPSFHGPHFAGINLLGSGRKYTSTPKRPTTPLAWREGSTFAYLIDLLKTTPNGKQTTVLRIHYQDAASPPPLGFPPRADILTQIGKKKTIGTDLAIVCVPNFDQVRRYPEGILQHLKARIVMFAHWESFFTQYNPNASSSRYRYVPFTKAREFHRRVDAILPAGVIKRLPQPGAAFLLEVKNSNAAKNIKGSKD